MTAPFADVRDELAARADRARALARDDARAARHGRRALHRRRARPGPRRPRHAQRAGRGGDRAEQRGRRACTPGERDCGAGSRSRDRDAVAAPAPSAARRHDRAVARCRPRVQRRDRRRIGVDDDWIVRRTGIRERRYARPDERLTDLAAAAGRAALERAGAGRRPRSTSCSSARCSQDERMPNAAPQVAHALGAHRAGAFDVGSACTGFLAALALGAREIESGRARQRARDRRRDHVAPVDPRLATTAALFGDGAGAVVLAPAPPGRHRPGRAARRRCARGADRRRRRRADPRWTATRPSSRRSTAWPRPRTAGRRRRRPSRSTTSTSSSTTRPTRGSSRARRAPRARLRRSVVDCIARLGNTSAASVPLALAQARGERAAAAGACACCWRRGAGFTWGATVVEWGRSMSRSQRTTAAPS